MAYKKSLRGDLFCPNVTGGISGAFNSEGYQFSEYRTNLTTLSGAITASKHNQWNIPDDQVTGIEEVYMNPQINAHLSNAIYSDNGAVIPLGVNSNYILKL